MNPLTDLNQTVSSNEVQSFSETLAANGVRVEQTMTTPSRPGKKPRPVWVVSGNTFGLEPFFRENGGRKFRGAWSFFEDPSEMIADELTSNGRGSYADQVEYNLERKEAKIGRYETYSENAEKRAEAASEKVNSISSMIPMGQPILVGHHSERRHRRDISRIDRGMRKSIEESKKADYYSHKASFLDYQVGRARESRKYIGNRIKEATRELAKLRRYRELTDDSAYIQQLDQRIVQTTEKLEFWQIRQSDLETKIVTEGGKVASASTIKVGDEINFHGWLPVIRINRKTVTVSHWLGVPTFTYKVEYTKIKDYRSPVTP